MPNHESVEQIVSEIFGITNPRIAEDRRPQIKEFVSNTINGDQASSHLVIDANLAKERKGILVYVITNLRLIKIEIDDKEIQSSSFPLDTMTGIERKLEDGGRAAIEVSFQNGSFGLRYAQNNHPITTFFQKVDQSRVRK